MRRMEKIAARSDDMMIVRGVNVFPTQIEELIFSVPSLAGHYQIVLTREGGWTRWKCKSKRVRSPSSRVPA